MTVKGRLLFTSASVDCGAKNITKLSSLEVLEVEKVEKDIFIIDEPALFVMFWRSGSLRGILTYEKKGLASRNLVDAAHVTIPNIE
jgi:hypothetical protein